MRLQNSQPASMKRGHLSSLLEDSNIVEKMAKNVKDPFLAFRRFGHIVPETIFL